MRYINWCFTNLLTYLLTYLPRNNWHYLGHVEHVGDDDDDDDVDDVAAPLYRRITLSVLRLSKL